MDNTNDFEILSVCRDDLREYFSDEQINKLSDEDMRDIAQTVADILFETVYWQTLREVTEHVLQDT